MYAGGGEASDGGAAALMHSPGRVSPVDGPIVSTSNSTTSPKRRGAGGFRRQLTNRHRADVPTLHVKLNHILIMQHMFPTDRLPVEDACTPNAGRFQLLCEVP